MIHMESTLPSIPAKRYFTIGEVSDLCGVKPHVLRYWEQEFTQLRPVKRRGNRRYYQHHEVLMIRRIRDLLYDQGFTITGARNKMQDNAVDDFTVLGEAVDAAQVHTSHESESSRWALLQWDHLRHFKSELFEIRALLADVS